MGVGVAALVLLLVAACSGDDAVASSATVGDTGGTSVLETDGGTVDETVPPTPAVELDPVALTEEADFGTGVRARIVAIEALELEAFVPGEVSGPGVSITIDIANDGPDALDLGLLLVDLVDAQGRSATLLTPREAIGHSGTIAPGASAEGTYLFTIAVDDRDDVTLRVNYLASEPTVVFQGSLPDA